MANGNDLAQAYSILGQATTSEYNRRRREEEEREKRMMRRQLLATFAQPLVKSAGEALTGAVGDLISSPFERKYEEFSNLEEIQKLRRAQKQGEKNKKFLNNTYDQIATSNMTQEDWFIEKAYEEIYKMSESQLDAAGLDPENRKQARRLWSREQAKKLGKARSKAFDAAYREMQDIGTSEDLEKLIKFNNRRPQNVLEGGMSALKRIFTPERTQEKIDEESLDSIRNSGLVKDQAEFAEAMKIYRRTGSFDDIAPMLASSMKLDPGVERKDTETGFQVADDFILITEKVSEEGEFGTTVVDEVTQIKPLMSDADGNPIIDEAEVLKGMNKVNNLYDSARQTLTSSALTALHTSLQTRKDKEGNAAPIVLSNLKTIDEYNVAARYLQQYIAADPGNVKDEARTRMAIGTLETLTTKRIPVIMDGFAAAEAFLEEGKEEEAMEQIRNVYKFMHSVSAVGGSTSGSGLFAPTIPASLL